MKRITTVVVGAGQAGLAMSHCLSERNVEHVVLDRGEVAQSWRSQRWDSLKLLTPRWQSRLPGLDYRGPDPDGYMSMREVVDFLSGYAERAWAPIETHTSVHAITPHGDGYRVATQHGEWQCRQVVLATGACRVANVPALSAALPADVVQRTPLTYRNPDQLPQGPVLVVGASASGMQLAAELRASGREVTLAVGEHIRMPRHYRGRDIQWWMDRAGLLDMHADEVDDLERARRVPSLQLMGSHTRQWLDLNSLQDAGVRITGRLVDVRDGEALFAGSLANQCALSDLKMNRLLDSVDAWADVAMPGHMPPPQRYAPTRCPAMPPLRLPVSGGRIRSVIWATGFRPDFSCLRLPVFDTRGRLRHQQGHVAPGLAVLGLPFMRRRKSALLDGVGDDARELADHLARSLGRQAA
ncbi:MAG: NAD(P)-binding domain-containing protein [Hydrogenophaga sp.]|uniref:flavin-containing monooxygenase n=1 Tax=Hydrogenophaga sp. TaxID=1904254 RepID=UPI001D4B808A|nr:NAD(P)/FAD-dependent oxidoreductase [Hydrogenophaga sp.]MBX3608704.1 NAD(P)-binding domain-containing protein [Hydrogenophaga sp.]